jgi:hypothetical protein
LNKILKKHSLTLSSRCNLLTSRIYMSIFKILGSVALTLGFVIIMFGLNSTQKVGEQVFEGAVGRYSSETMKYLLGGLALIISGSACLLIRK